MKKEISGFRFTKRGNLKVKFLIREKNKDDYETQWLVVPPELYDKLSPELKFRTLRDPNGEIVLELLLKDPESFRLNC